MRLNQVIALVQGRKARAAKTLTDAHRVLVADNLKGISRTYQPFDDEGEKLPPERKSVSFNTKQVFAEVLEKLHDFYDVVATQETANQSAKANILVDSVVLIPEVPITVLLFFEKQLIDLLTFTRKLPVLPVDKTWSWDDNKGCFVSESEETTRTQKVPEVVVKYAATKEHPAQTEMFAVDKTVGIWKTIHMSGALPKCERDYMIERIEKLQDAVKSARESANSVVVEKGMSGIGTKFVDFIFNG